MFKILGAKNRRKNLHKHPGPPFQIREGPGSFSNAKNSDTYCKFPAKEDSKTPNTWRIPKLVENAASIGETR